MYINCGGVWLKSIFTYIPITQTYCCIFIVYGGVVLFVIVDEKVFERDIAFGDINFVCLLHGLVEYWQCTNSFGAILNKLSYPFFSI